MINIDKLVDYDIQMHLHLFDTRYGYGVAVILIPDSVMTNLQKITDDFDSDNFDDMRAFDYFNQDWFPIDFGKTYQEALKNLEDKIKSLNINGDTKEENVKFIEWLNKVCQHIENYE